MEIKRDKFDLVHRGLFIGKSSRPLRFVLGSERALKRRDGLKLPREWLHKPRNLQHWLPVTVRTRARASSKQRTPVGRELGTEQAS